MVSSAHAQAPVAPGGAPPLTPSQLDQLLGPLALYPDSLVALILPASTVPSDINGNMIAGFALVAFPSKWGDSGIMTFIINQQGKLYQRDLGAKTEEIARTMTEYNPDKNWVLVPEQNVTAK